MRHDAQDIFPGRQRDLLAHRTRPSVAAGFQGVGVARGLGCSVLGKLGGRARLRVSGARGLPAWQEVSLKLTA
jgi:hypothetical protein